jgi:hypothetical protein
MNALNPFLTTLQNLPATPPLPLVSHLVRIPQAPVNASPVPGLTSLYHRADAGPWGNRGYPGNCSGYLIRDLIRFYGATTVYDLMSGSGTCREVCRDLGIYSWSADIHEGIDACDVRFADTFDFAWLHPPYWRQKLYADDPKDLSREPTLAGFLTRYEQLLRACAKAVKPGGRMAVLMGDYHDREEGFVPLVYHTKQLAFAAGLKQCATDIIRFSHGVSSSRKVYKSSFIPGLHDTCVIFEKPQVEAL